METLILIALKSLVLAGGVLLMLKLASRRSAADRSLIAHLGLAAVLLLPAGSLLLPPLGVSGPQFLAGEPTLTTEPVMPASDVAIPSVSLDALPASEAAVPSFLGGIDLATLLYALPAILLAALTLAALMRLMILKARANVLVEPQWVNALARAQHRMGFKHGTALLTSDELPSPISWGVVRPIILLNSEAAQAHGQAEAVIAHELAHVAHLDWAKLLLARIVVALFWFNPLVWLLAREAHQLREEAADDAVLAANIEDTEYAQLLVGVARHECRGLLIGAHGVAPAKNSLARRVRRVLDGALERAPGGWRWSSAAAFFAAGMAVPLAALTVVPGVQPVAAPTAAKATAAAPAPASASAALPTANVAPSVAGTGLATAPVAAGSDDKVLRLRDGTTMVASRSGRAVMYGPDGTTMVADADGTATVFMNGRAVATANARSGRAEASGHDRISRAVEMRAVGATPEYAQSLRSVLPGVRISDGQLVQLKAVGVTRDYIRGLAAVGYRNLSLSTLVELRALGVMPSDITRVRQSSGRLPTPHEMVKIKALGVTAEDLDHDPDLHPEPDDPDPDDGS